MPISKTKKAKHFSPIGKSRNIFLILVLFLVILYIIYMIYNMYPSKKMSIVKDYFTSYSSTCSNTANSTINGSALCTMTVYYASITTDDVIYLLNDIWSNSTYSPTTSTLSTMSYNLYNIYVNYTNLKYSGTVSSFTSYYEYCDSSNTLKSNTDYTITFLSGPNNVYMGSTTGTTQSYTLPVSGQSGTFCLPLIRVPTTATNFAVGIKLVTLSGTTYTTYYHTVKMASKSTSYSASSPNTSNTDYMMTFSSNIYDSASKEYATVLPSLSGTITTALPSGVSLLSTSPSSTYTPISGGMTTSAYRYLIFAALNNDYSYYNVNLYTTSFSSLINTPPVGSAKIYFSTNTAPTPNSAVNLGCWFMPSTYAGQPTPSPTSTQSCYSTSNTYLNMTSKMNNFATPGLTASSGGTYTFTPSTKTLASGASYPYFTITASLFPTHPYGTFPSTSTTSLSSYVATNPAIATLKPLTAVLTPTSTKATIQNLGSGAIGYLFDNAILYAGGDAEGYTPTARESLDIFFGHPDSSYYYHHHFIGPPMTNWCMSNTMRIIGIMTDGYPLVAPFIVKDTSTSLGYRYVKSSDLNSYHGLEGNFTYTISSASSSTTTTTSQTYTNVPFIYVTTFDFPFTASAFYGKPGTVST